MKQTADNDPDCTAPPFPDEEWRNVRELFRNNELDSAKNLLEKLASEMSEEAAAALSHGMFELSLEAEEKGELSKALFASSTIVKIWPDDFQQQLRAANLLRDMGKLDEAALLYQKVITNFPSQPGGYIGISVVFERQSKPKQAIVAAKNAIKHAPTQPSLHHNLACQYRNAGRSRKAEEAFQMALKLNPYWRDSLIEYSFMLEKRGLINRAIRLVSRAIRINPSNEMLPDRLELLKEKAANNRKAAKEKQEASVHSG